MRREAGQHELVVDYPCGSCGVSMVFQPADGWLVCETSWCAAVGMSISLWRAEQRRAGAAGEPEQPAAGWPRPQMAGLPVPWITPVAAGRARFRLVHGGRLLACQTGWLCQVCGRAVPPRAWLVVGRDGCAVTSAAMHRRCLHVAARWCPHLAGSADHVQVEVTRGQVIADGVSLPEAPTPLVQQLWKLAL